MNRNAHSLLRQNELEQQLMRRSAPNDAVLPEPRPPAARPPSDLDALFALTKRFCCVQIGNCVILLVAVPASVYCMVLSIGILAGFLGSIRFVEVRCAAKSEREKRDVFGRHWLLLMHLWLPYAAMTRAHEAWRFTAPVWAYGLGTTVWIVFGLYQRQLGLRPEIRLWTGVVVSVSFLAHVPYTDMGQPIEGLLVAGGIAFGELLGLTLEAQRAQVQVEVERETQRVLNHTAKRLMCNTAQAAQLVLSQLDDLASDDPSIRNTARSETEEVLRSCWAATVMGYNACRANLLQRRLHDSIREPFCVDELLTAVCWPPAKFVVQKPRTFCRPAGDRVLVETVLFNATQNARLHGGDAPVQVSAAFSCHEDDCDLRLEVINVAGRNHAQLRALRVQDLLSADVDFAALGMGSAESTFLGLRDIMLAAKAMEPPAAVELRVEEASVRFVMVCTLKVASDEEPVQRGAKRSRDLPDGLCYVVLDDDKITRLLARKQIAKFGPHPSSIVLGGSRQEALSVPERVRTLAREVGEENVVVILDQNLSYPDGDVLGTDLAAALRRDAYGGTIVIQSANAEPSDCITYADAGADGTLAKGVLAATSAAELALIFWGRLAKGRKRRRA